MAAIQLCDSYRLEPIEAHRRIGVILLNNDDGTEEDMHRLRGTLPIKLHVARLTFDVGDRFEDLTKLLPHIAAAAESMIPNAPFDSYIYSCTSGTMLLGHDTIADAIAAVRPGVAVVTPMMAAVDALKQLNARRIAMLAPYPLPICELMISFMAEHGVEVITAASFGIADPGDIARLDERSIFEAATSMDMAGAAALFIPCTSARTATLIAPLELHIGIPVVTSNQAQFWQALRKSGLSDAIDGFGALMARC